MKLVIGGTAQGKLEYVLTKHGMQKNMVWDGCIQNDMEREEKFVIINNFHQWFKRRMLGGGSPEGEIMSFLDCHGDCIIICNEIGNGIVPADPFEREYRERMGKILVQLAERAEEVERIICGIGQKIK